MEYHAIPELVTKIAEKSGATEAQVRAFLRAQAEAAYELAPGGCPIPGIGVLGVVGRPEQVKQGMAGRPFTLPAKQILKFRVSHVAKDAVLSRARVPDVLEAELLRPDEQLAD